MARRRNSKGQFVKAGKKASNPRTRRAASVPVAAGTNPRKRRRRASAATASRRTVRRYRRNPSPRGMNVGRMFLPALTGAAGAVAVDAVLNAVPLPLTLKTGTARHLTRAGAAVLLGIVGSKLVKGRLAAEAANGALIVALHGALAETVSKYMPGTLGAYVDMTRPVNALGYYSAGLIPAAPMPEPVADATEMGAYVENGYTY